MVYGYQFTFVDIAKKFPIVVEPTFTSFVNAWEFQLVYVLDEFWYFRSFKFSPLWGHKFSFSRPEHRSGLSNMRVGVTTMRAEGF